MDKVEEREANEKIKLVADAFTSELNDILEKVESINRCTHIGSVYDTACNLHNTYKELHYVVTMLNVLDKIEATDEQELKMLDKLVDMCNNGERPVTKILEEINFEELEEDLMTEKVKEIINGL